MTPEKIVQTVRKDGLIMLQKFVNPANQVINEFDKIMEDVEDRSADCMINGSWKRYGDHNTGKMMVVRPDSYEYIPHIISVFNTQFFKDIVSIFYGAGKAQFMLQIYFSHDYVVLDKKDWPRNAHTHFDPFQAIKFMLLLTSCSKKNGAFRYIPGSQGFGKQCRQKHDVEKLLNSSAYTLEDNLNQDYCEDQMVYCDGDPGDVLVFDTDVLHGGGVLLEKSERKSVIIHNRT